MTPPPDPTAGPKKVLPYQTPPSPAAPRAFGSFGGYMAVGLGLFVASLVMGATLGLRLRHAGPWTTFGPAGVVMTLGVVAAIFPRYRGVLTGMLLVVLLAMGVVLLVIG